MVANDLLMQIQADVLQSAVTRPREIETTAMGAAFAAGLGAGVWTDLEELSALVAPDTTWKPGPAVDDLYAEWNRAVERTLDWA